MIFHTFLSLNVQEIAEAPVWLNIDLSDTQIIGSAAQNILMYIIPCIMIRVSIKVNALLLHIASNVTFAALFLNMPRSVVLCCVHMHTECMYVHHVWYALPLLLLTINNGLLDRSP